MPDLACHDEPTPIFDQVTEHLHDALTRHPWQPDLLEPAWPSSLTGALRLVAGAVALSTPTQAMEVITDVEPGHDEP